MNGMDSVKGHLVKFGNVKEHYDCREPVVCEFSVTNIPSLRSVWSDGGCYVGIFPVGWECLQDAVVRKIVALVDSSAVSFSGAEIPESDINAFYQFCCFNEKEDCLLGASGPFQITSFPENESFVRIERESIEHCRPAQMGMSESVLKHVNWYSEASNDADVDTGVIVVHNRTTMLEKALVEIANENSALKSWKVKSEQSSEELHNCIKSLESQVADLQRREALLLQNLNDLSNTAKGDILLEKSRFEKQALELSSFKVAPDDNSSAVSTAANLYNQTLAYTKGQIKSESDFEGIVAALVKEIEMLKEQNSKNLMHATQYEVKLIIEQEKSKSLSMEVENLMKLVEESPQNISENRLGIKELKDKDPKFTLVEKNAYAIKCLECQQLMLRIHELEANKIALLESCVCMKCKGSLPKQDLVAAVCDEAFNKVQKKEVQRSTSLAEHLVSSSTDKSCKLKETAQLLKKDNQTIKHQMQALPPSGLDQKSELRTGQSRISEDNASFACSVPSLSKGSLEMERPVEPPQQAIYRPSSVHSQAALFSPDAARGSLRTFAPSRLPNAPTRLDDPLFFTRAALSPPEKRQWQELGFEAYQQQPISTTRPMGTVRDGIVQAPLPTGSLRWHQAEVDLRSYCPVCNLEFPAGATDEFATRHVNSHFGEH